MNNIRNIDDLYITYIIHGLRILYMHSLYILYYLYITSTSACVYTYTHTVYMYMCVYILSIRTHTHRITKQTV